MEGPKSQAETSKTGHIVKCKAVYVAKGEDPMITTVLHLSNIYVKWV